MCAWADGRSHAHEACCSVVQAVANSPGLPTGPPKNVLRTSCSLPDMFLEHVWQRRSCSYALAFKVLRTLILFSEPSFVLTTSW
eukprot:7347897-Pyramimonas_sp.AAC.1